jgi:hypothetical protein
MDKIIELTKSTYEWSDDYANLVFVEYERFLLLRLTNENLSPSEDIDKLWHTHILCSKHYETYCQEKFNKFIHHDAIDSIESDDKTPRINRITNTLIEYKKQFGNYNEIVWSTETIKKQSFKKHVENFTSYDNHNYHDTIVRPIRKAKKEIKICKKKWC